MLFPVIDQIFNGTITINITVSAIEADNFIDAKNILKNKLKAFTALEITTDNDITLQYKGIHIVGTLKNKELNIIKE